MTKGNSSILPLDAMLEEVAEANGSDLHLATGILPVMRVNGELTTLQDTKHILTEDKLMELCSALLGRTPELTEHFQKEGSADTSYSFRTAKGHAIHSRVNIFRDTNGLSFAFRLINDYVPSMEELRLPQSLRLLRQEPYGLIILTGATGSGKSTTIASLLDAINAERAAHIITIENPVEYHFTMKKSIISQREVGRDCTSFLSGLRDALRQDPDVILIGEMRDAETISTALAAAETGHLVFSTLHAGNVVEALDRLVQYFPAEQHREIRSEIANSLCGLIAQKLLKSSRGGRIAAFEILLATDATKNIIRTGQGFRIRDYMNPADGMQTMEEALRGLRNKKLIA